MVEAKPGAAAPVPVPGRMPPWFKVSALVVGGFLVVFLGLHFAGVGGGPGRHVAPAGPSTLDTGDIAPGGEAQLTFGSQSLPIHCDPHPFMRQNVTVAEGGPSEAHVDILDGDATSEYRFEPANLTIASGATVTYHNHGRLVHTATQGEGHSPAGH